MKKLLLLSALLFFSCSYAQGEQLYADGSTTDQDGNVFEWINYGTQDWAIDNAEVVTYRDGTLIPQVTDPQLWENLSTGAWCYYDNDPTKDKLYNWWAIIGNNDNDPNTPNKNFAPEGWETPSDLDWTELEDYLIEAGYNFDGTNINNRIAKSMASADGWIYSPSLGVPGNSSTENNRSGFNAQPIGYRNSQGSFSLEGDFAEFWSTTVYLVSPFTRVIDNNRNYLGRSYTGYRMGLSVRFVRNATTTLDDCNGIQDNIPDIIQCDDYGSNDGVGNFDLTDLFPSILNGQDPSNYNISFHLSLIDAENNTSPILSPYTNTAPYFQTIYTRTTNTDNSCLSISSFNIIVEPIPEVNSPGNYIYENGATSDEVVFSNPNNDETVLYSWIMDNDIGLPISGVGNIPSGTLYNADCSPVTATVTVTPMYESSNCFGYAKVFTITVNNVSCNYETVHCDDAPYETSFCYDTNVDNTYTFTSAEGFSLNLNISQGQVESSWDKLEIRDTDGTVLYNGDGNIGDLSGLSFESSGDTIILEIIEDNSISCVSSGYTPISVVITCQELSLDDCDINNSDILLNQCDADGSNDGFASFNLLDASFILNSQDPSNYNISFHLSYIDAENNTNPILSDYTNTTPYSQTIFMRITNIDNTCLSISSILLQVDDVGDFMLEPIPDQEICNCDTIEPVLFNSNNPNISAYFYVVDAENYLYGYQLNGTGNIDSYQLCNETPSFQAVLTYSVVPFNIENGCTGEPLTFTITVLADEDCTASVTDPSLLNFSIYPNPAKDRLYIDSDNVNNIIVYNIFGKEIIKINNQNTIDVSSLSKGVYFIKVSDGINSSTKKFIKN